MAPARIQDLPVEAALSDTRANVLVFSAVQAEPIDAASRVATTTTWPLLTAAAEDARAKVRVLAAVQAEPTTAASRDAIAQALALTESQEPKTAAALSDTLAQS